MCVMNDADIIDALGGPAKLAELLGFDKTQGGVQRVHNWRARGIPSKVKLERPDLFRVAPAPIDHAQGEVTNAA